jgi:hypothetical protein
VAVVVVEADLLVTESLVVLVAVAVDLRTRVEQTVRVVLEFQVKVLTEPMLTQQVVAVAVVQVRLAILTETVTVVTVLRTQ